MTESQRSKRLRSSGWSEEQLVAAYFPQGPVGLALVVAGIAIAPNAILSILFGVVVGSVCHAGVLAFNRSVVGEVWPSPSRPPRDILGRAFRRAVASGLLPLACFVVARFTSDAVSFVTAGIGASLAAVFVTSAAGHVSRLGFGRVWRVFVGIVQDGRP